MINKIKYFDEESILYKLERLSLVRKSMGRRRKHIIHYKKLVNTNQSNFFDTTQSAQTFRNKKTLICEVLKY